MGDKLEHDVIVYYCIAKSINFRIIWGHLSMIIDEDMKYFENYYSICNNIDSQHQSCFQSKFEYAYFVLVKNQSNPIIPSTIPEIDSLLHGGFEFNNIYLLYGSSFSLKDILHRVAASSLIKMLRTSEKIDKVEEVIRDNGVNRDNDIKRGNKLKEDYGVAQMGDDDPPLICYIDGTNQFDPYLISHILSDSEYNPLSCLDRILVARAFNWNQIVEIVERQLGNYPEIRVLLISGFTLLGLLSLSESGTSNSNLSFFNDLKRMLLGINRLREQHFRRTGKPLLILLTAPLSYLSNNSVHNYNLSAKPFGGHLLTHFASVIIGVFQTSSGIYYCLDQHPNFPFQIIFRKILTERKIKHKERSFSHSYHSFYMNMKAPSHSSQFFSLIPSSTSSKFDKNSHSSKNGSLDQYLFNFRGGS